MSSRPSTLKAATLAPLYSISLQALFSGLLEAGGGELYTGLSILVSMPVVVEAMGRGIHGLSWGRGGVLGLPPDMEAAATAAAAAAATMEAGCGGRGGGGATSPCRPSTLVIIEDLINSNNPKRRRRRRSVTNFKTLCHQRHNG